MIVSTDLEDIFPQIENKGIAQAIQNYIKSRQGISDFKHGKKETVSKGISVVTIQAESGTQKENVLEAHKKFYDVHYTIKGTDTIAYKAVKECNNILENYKEEGDYILYNEKSEKILEIPEGSFCLVPNIYAHAALYIDKGQVTKLVFKVPAL